MSTVKSDQCYSILKRIETCLRNTMNEARFGTLAMISVNKTFIYSRGTTSMEKFGLFCFHERWKNWCILTIIFITLLKHCCFNFLYADCDISNTVHLELIFFFFILRYVSKIIDLLWLKTSMEYEWVFYNFLSTLFIASNRIKSLPHIIITSRLCL